MFHGEAYSLKPELNSTIEEVGARLIPHVILGGKVLGRSAKIVISSTDTDVLMLLVHYFESLLDEAIEAFNLFGGGDKARLFPVYSLVQNFLRSQQSANLEVPAY